MGWLELGRFTAYNTDVLRHYDVQYAYSCTNLQQLSGWDIQRALICELLCTGTGGLYVCADFNKTIDRVCSLE